MRVRCNHDKFRVLVRTTVLLETIYYAWEASLIVTWYAEMVDRKQKGGIRKGGPEKEDVKNCKSIASTYWKPPGLLFSPSSLFGLPFPSSKSLAKFWQNSLKIERTNIGRSFFQDLSKCTPPQRAERRKRPILSCVRPFSVIFRIQENATKASKYKRDVQHDFVSPRTTSYWLQETLQITTYRPAQLVGVCKKCLRLS